MPLLSKALGIRQATCPPYYILWFRAAPLPEPLWSRCWCWCSNGPSGTSRNRLPKHPGRH